MCIRLPMRDIKLGQRYPSLLQSELEARTRLPMREISSIGTWESLFISWWPDRKDLLLMVTMGMVLYLNTAELLSLLEGRHPEHLKEILKGIS